MSKKKAGVIVFVALLVVVNVALKYYNYDNRYSKYDREHIKYSYNESIVFYTENGEQYKVDHKKYVLYSIDSNKTIKGNNAWVNKDGYLVEIPGSELNYDESLPLNSPYSHYDNKGNYYADPFLVCWDENGNIIIYGISNSK